MGKLVLIIAGDYVEDYEVMMPFQALVAIGVSVHVVCPGKEAGEKIITAIHDNRGYQTFTETPGHFFSLNKTFDDVHAEDYDALVVPGGRAAEYLSLDTKVLELVRSFTSSHKVVASIGQGPLILAAAGVLKGKKTTADPGLKPILRSAGADWNTATPISASCVDGKLITSAAWSGLPDFIQNLLKALGIKVEGAKKKVLFIVGDYVEDYEVFVPYATLLALDVAVDVVSPGFSKGDKVATAVHDFEGAQTYSEKPGHLFELTASFDELDIEQEKYDALVIPGGRAPQFLSLNDRVVSVVKSFFEASKPVAAICHGPQLLAAADVLKDRKCTAYPAVRAQVTLAGAQWLDPARISQCFTDGNLVTGAAWPAHPEFIAQLLVLLELKVSF